MNNEWDYGYGEDDGSDEWFEANDTGAECHAAEMNVQERWEEENDVKSLLDNDPGYHNWSDELDRQAAEDREIVKLADIEIERTNVGMTIEGWDRS